MALEAVLVNHHGRNGFAGKVALIAAVACHFYRALVGRFFDDNVASLADVDHASGINFRGHQGFTLGTKHRGLLTVK